MLYKVHIMSSDCVSYTFQVFPQTNELKQKKVSAQISKSMSQVRKY
jgi:hypothetical protein